MNTHHKKFFVVIILFFVISVLSTGALSPAMAQEKKNKTEPIISHERGRHKYSYKSGATFNSFSLDYRGKIALTDDEKDIKSISPGGYFKVSKTTFGTRRIVKIENKGDNQLVRTYYVGRKEEPFELNC